MSHDDSMAWCLRRLRRLLERLCPPDATDRMMMLHYLREIELTYAHAQAQLEALSRERMPY